MKPKALLFLLAAATSLTSIAGCVAQPAEANLPTKRPARFSVVDFDVSETTIGDREEYLTTFEFLLTKLLGYGDSLYIGSITQDSLQSTKPISEIMVPSYAPPPRPVSQWYDMPLTQTAEKNNYKRVKAAKKRDFLKENDLQTIRQQIVSAVQNRILTEKAGNTDIFGALIYAGQLFMAKPDQEKVLILFGDMRQEDDRYNFRTEQLSDERIAQIINEEKSRNRLPNLADVHVFVIGAKASDQEAFLNVKKFWLAYFKEAGAVEPRFYGRSLPEVIIDSSVLN